MFSWWLSKIRLFWLKGSRRRLVMATSLSQRVYRKLSIKEASLQALKKKAKTHEKKLMLLSESLLEEIEDVENLREDFEKSLKQTESALESVREECEVYKDVTIPTLLAQHKLVLAQYEEQTAIAVRNQTIAQITREER